MPMESVRGKVITIKKGIKLRNLAEKLNLNLNFPKVQGCLDLVYRWDFTTEK